MTLGVGTHVTAQGEQFKHHSDPLATVAHRVGFCRDDSGAGVATVVTDVVDNGGCALAGGSSVFVDMHRELTAPLNYNTMEILAAGESVTSVARVTSSSSYEALANGVGGPYGSGAVKMNGCIATQF